MNLISEAIKQSIKDISIIDFLANRGIYPQKENGHEAWYCSPLRNEKTASFKVSKTYNNFWDFGSGQSGDIIQLVRDLQGVDFKEAIHYLSNGQFESLPSYQNNSFSFDCKENSNVLEVTKVQALQNTALIDYIESRCIPYSTAQKYVKDIYYRNTNTNKRFFSLAFENISKGYATRNKLPKSKINIGTNNYSLIHGNSARNLLVFEGFMDFLSYLVYYEMQVPKYDTIVLNSLSNLNKAMQSFEAYTKLFLFLDNDTEKNNYQGQKATKRIIETYPNALNFSHIYEGFKDFNEFLLSLHS